MQMEGRNTTQSVIAYQALMIVFQHHWSATYIVKIESLLRECLPALRNDIKRNFPAWSREVHGDSKEYIFQIEKTLASEWPYFDVEGCKVIVDGLQALIRSPSHITKAVRDTLVLCKTPVLLLDDVSYPLYSV